MMNSAKIIKTVLVIIFLFSFQVVGFSQEAKDTSVAVNSKAKSEKGFRKFQGKVLSVDANSKVITVRGKMGKIHSLKIDSSTRIKQGKNIIKLSDVKKGSKIKINYSLNDKKEKIAKALKIVEPEIFQESKTGDLKK